MVSKHLLTGERGRPQAPILVTTALSVGLVAGSAAAAEIDAVGSMQADPANECSVVLLGEIVSGDLQKLSEIITEAIVQNPNYPSALTEEQIVLCLESSGGSFLEGLRMAEFVSDMAVTTKVRPGAQCLSACALVFMGGNLDTRSGAGWQPSRYLHPTSRLGFHAPRLDLPEEGFSRQDVDRAYASALLAIGLVSQKADKLRMSQTLLTEMVSHIGNDFEFIDTVDDIAINSIQMYGYDAPPMTLEASYNACWNAFRWTFHVNSFEHSLDAFDLTYLELSPRVDGLITFVPFDGEMYCRHEVVSLGGGDKDQVIQSELSDLSDPRVREVRGPWIRLLGPTPLSEIPLGTIRDF